MILTSEMRKLNFVACAAFFGASFLASTDAEASGYLTARYGGTHGTPAVPNTYAIYFNPAALGGTTGTTIVGDVSVVFRSASYQRTADALSPSDPNYASDPSYVAANTGKANLFDVVPLPFLGVSTDFGTKNLRGGYAIYAPYGGAAEWKKKDAIAGVPGSEDGPQRWHNISGRILAIYNTFALAYRNPEDRLTIGISVSPVIHSVSTVRARNADGSDDTVVNGNLIEGRSLLEASGFNMTGAFGVYWEPTNDLHFGFSYTGIPGFGGETRMRGTLSTQLGSTAPDKKDVDFYQAYPDVFRLGVTGRVSPKLEIRGDVSYERWSLFKRQCIVPKGEKCNVADDGRDLSGGKVILNIPRNWDDSMYFRVGPGYWVNDKLEIHGAVALSTPAVPKETIDASTIDAYRLDGTVGARYQINDHFAIDGSYSHLHYFSVDTKGKNDLDLSSHPASGPDGGLYNASRSPSGDGKYNSEVGLVNVNVAYTF